MADKFYDGMLNVNEKLNEMDRAFAAGPYNALPLTGGVLNGPLAGGKIELSDSLTVAARYVAAQEVLNLNVVSGLAGLARTVIKMGYPFYGYGTRIVSGGDPTLAFAGYTSFETGQGSAGFYETARFTAEGALLIGSATSSGSETLQVTGSASFLSAAGQGAYLLKVGLKGAVSSIAVYAGDGQVFAQQQAVMFVARNSNTDRSVSANGTVNTMGNDYAEYILKSSGCAPVAKGQIIGLTAHNSITDQWSDAVLFAIKSTAPSFVGGDAWASSVGPRPVSQAGSAPVQPERRTDLVEQKALPGTKPVEYVEVLVSAGDTDAEWAAKQAVHAAAIAAHNSAVLHDAEQMATFDAALEVERQKVDRIAIAGRVPVNVMGARPGDYIVPVQDGEGIAGIAVHADDITMAQYLRAVGRVISIEPDGRAYVMVKAV